MTRFPCTGLAMTLGLGCLLAAAPDASAQGVPPNIDREAIIARVRAELPKVVEAAEAETLEVEGIARLTYKKIPTDPRRIAEILGQDPNANLPAGVNIEQYIGMFQNEITQFLNEALADVGTFEALVNLKVRSRAIPAGTYRFGMAFEGERPVAVVLKPTLEDGSVDEEQEPIALRLRAQGAEMQPELAIILREPRRQREGKEKFELRIAVMRSLAKTSEFDRDEDD